MKISNLKEMRSKRISVFFTFILLLYLVYSQEEIRVRARRNDDILYGGGRKSAAGLQESRRRSLIRTSDIRRNPAVVKPKRSHEDDDTDDEEVVLVAMSPPPVRAKTTTPKYEPRNKTVNYATDLVKDVLLQLGQDLLFKQANEDFVFGQYIGNVLKNLTSELKNKMQHEILEILIKYQKLDALSKGKDNNDKISTLNKKDVVISNNIVNSSNVDESWQDFNNLAKIVG